MSTGVPVYTSEKPVSKNNDVGSSSNYPKKKAEVEDPHKKEKEALMKDLFSGVGNMNPVSNISTKQVGQSSNNTTTATAANNNKIINSGNQPWGPSPS